MSEKRPLPDWLGLVPIAALFVVHARTLDARVQDDAFITFRYAKNLVHGDGLVMNPGERVEGVTSLLFTLLSALPEAVSADPLTFARWVSQASGVATCFALFFLSRRLVPGPTALALVAPTLVAGSWAYAVNAMTGLETALFSALLVGAAVAYLGGRLALASALFGLAGLTRPEAVGLFVALSGWVVWERRRDRRALARWLVPFALLVGASVVFRRAYYGAWVPNTFVAKAGVPLPPSLPTPSKYLLQFFEKEGDLSYVLLALAVLGFVVSPSRKAHALSLVMLGWGVFNVVQNGADFMLGGRYLVPYAPFLWTAAALGGHGLATRFRLASEHAAAALFAGALVLGVLGYRRSVDKVRPFEEVRRRVSADAVNGAVDALRGKVPDDARIATLDIGELGYRTRYRLIDISGLTDPEIARTKGDLFDRDLDVTALFARDLDAIVLVSQAPEPIPLRAGNPYWPPGSSAKILAAPEMKGFVHAGSSPAYRALVRENGELRPARPGEPGMPATYHMEVWVRRR